MFNSTIKAVKLFLSGNNLRNYVNSLKLMDFIHIHVCFLSVGAFVGSLICGNNKKLMLGSLTVMLGTYVPIVYKFTKFMSALSLYDEQRRKEYKNV